MSKNKGPAVIDKIVYRDIKEESTRFLELKTGKLDVVYSVPTMFISKIEADKNLTITRLPGKVLYHMIMNTQAAPLDNPLVRKGIALAVDQKRITHSVFCRCRQTCLHLSAGLFTSQQTWLKTQRSSIIQKLPWQRWTKPAGKWDRTTSGWTRTAKS